MTRRVIILTVLCSIGALAPHPPARAATNPNAPAPPTSALQPLFSGIPAQAAVPDAYKNLSDAYQEGYIGTVSGERHSGGPFMKDTRVCAAFPPDSLKSNACDAGRVAGEALLVQGMKGKEDPSDKTCGYKFDGETDAGDHQKRCECVADLQNGNEIAAAVCTERGQIENPPKEPSFLGMPKTQGYCTIGGNCEWCGKLKHRSIHYDHITCWGLGFKDSFGKCDSGSGPNAEIQTLLRTKNPTPPTDDEKSFQPHWGAIPAETQ